jgi:hypothetical protein
MKMGYENSLGAPRMSFDLNAGLWHFYDLLDKRKRLIEQHVGPLWEDEQESYEEMVRLGSVMITHYDLVFKSIDPYYRLYAAEQEFRVPFPKTDKICYEGWMDGVIEDQAGNLWVLEYKTTARMSNMPWVFRGMQATMYTWAASQIYNRPCRGVIYRVLLKKIPHMPKLTSRKVFSRAKSQKMTMEWARYCIGKMVQKEVDQWVGKNPTATDDQIDQVTLKLQRAYDSAAEGLYDMVRTEGHTFFFNKRIPRGQHQIDTSVESMRITGLEMVRKDIPITYNTGYHCQWCMFRDPCDLLIYNKPEAAQAVLAVEYAPRSYWEDLDELEDE